MNSFSAAMRIRSRLSRPASLRRCGRSWRSHESTGLELARRFDRSIPYFWPASHQQVYRELDSLESAGLVEVGPAPSKPTRGQSKRFRITSSGTAELGSWIAQVDEPTVLCESLLVKLRAAAMLGDLEGVRHGVEHHLATYEQMLETYREIEQRDFADPSGRTATLRHLVLESGLQLATTWIIWHRQVLDALDALESEDAGS